MKKVTFTCLIVGFLLPGQLLFAEIINFAFTTDPQVIPVSILSGPVTVASYNESDAPENVSETTDLVFTSTSQTGQFLNSVGSPVSTTMSKNTGNRTFYYRDSSAGTFTLKVKAIGRTSQKSFIDSQTITIGTSSVVKLPILSVTSSTSPSASSSDTGDNTVLSSTASSASVNNQEIEPSLKISAGRDRLSSVGSEISFKASATKLAGISSQGISYIWSFGDGSSAQGQAVSHVYRFPGDYEVVVNAGLKALLVGNDQGDIFSVSRITAHVILPDLVISKVVGGTKISNHSSTEINIGLWALQSGVRRFNLPLDTIIQAGKSSVIANEISGLSDRDIDISLFNSFNKMVVYFQPDKNGTTTTTMGTSTIVISTNATNMIATSTSPIKTILKIVKKQDRQKQQYNL